MTAQSLTRGFMFGVVRSLPGVLFACCAVILAVTVWPSTSQAVDSDGPSGRYMLQKGWYDRPDPSFSGIHDGFQSVTSLAGWRPGSVPLAANAGDFTPASYTGFVHWYRNDFTLPRGGRGADWVLRFESVNHRATVWLNGRPLGKHVGAYLPFELPARHIRRGVNHLVLRVDSRRGPAD